MQDFLQAIACISAHMTLIGYLDALETAFEPLLSPNNELFPNDSKIPQVILPKLSPPHTCAGVFKARVRMPPGGMILF
jgi:hypothetical protein